MPLLKKVLLLPHLADVCREHREGAGVKPIEVAVAAGFGAETSISHDFEQGRSSWGSNPDAVVMAYAATTGASVFDLWDEAVSRARAAKADLDWMK